MTARFQKYEGIGNDFIVVRAETPDSISVERAVALCDRHYGIGGDGVLVVSPGETSGARAKMTVLNADGSRPAMCGNGLRCVALAVAGDGEPDEFVIDTDAGPRFCRVTPATGGNQALVSTSMGRGVLEGSVECEVGGQTEQFARVSMGNPHAICFRGPISSQLLDDVGPRLSATFPAGSNIEIATVESPTKIRVDVWERGVGRTLACGTGAAATAVAAVTSGRSPTGTPIAVHLPGGPLHITVSPELDVLLEGPARFVFSGELPV